MQTRLPVEWDAVLNQEAENPRVLIAYDDLPAGKNAVQVLNNIFQQCDEVQELRPMVWKFDLLEDPEWSSTAFEDAMKADILVIATSNDLSVAVQNWIERFCDGKNGSDTAIVALCGYRSSRVKSVERAARDARLDFFAPALALDNVGDRWCAQAELPPLGDPGATSHMPTARPTRVDPYQHWGLNE
jgi:hypothetical protein